MDTVKTLVTSFFGPAVVASLVSSVAGLVYRGPNAAAARRTLVRRLSLLVIAVSVLASVASVFLAGPPEDRGTGLYGLVGVPCGASNRDISAQFRLVTRTMHPDKIQARGGKVSPEKEERFQAISEAVNLLKEDKPRFLYDRFGMSNMDGIIKFSKDIDIGEVLGYKLMTVAWFWLYRVLYLLGSAFLGQQSTTAFWGQLTIILLLGGLEACHITRQYNWWLPIPPFQVINIVHKSLNAILGAVSIVLPPPTSALDSQVVALARTVQANKAFAQTRLKDSIAKFQKDQEIMQTFRDGVLHRYNHYAS